MKKKRKHGCREQVGVTRKERGRKALFCLTGNICSVTVTPHSNKEVRVNLRRVFAYVHERGRRGGVVCAAAETLICHRHRNAVLVYEERANMEKVLAEGIPAHTPYIKVWQLGSIQYRFEGPYIVTLALEGRPTFLRLESDPEPRVGELNTWKCWRVLPGEDSHPGWANRVFREQKIRGKRRRLARKRVTKKTTAQIMHYIDLLYEADPKN
jgi:hypothetical protein